MYFPSPPSSLQDLSETIVCHKTSKAWLDDPGYSKHLVLAIGLCVGRLANTELDFLLPKRKRIIFMLLDLNRVHGMILGLLSYLAEQGISIRRSSHAHHLLRHRLSPLSLSLRAIIAHVRSLASSHHNTFVQLFLLLNFSRHNHHDEAYKIPSIVS